MESMCSGLARDQAKRVFIVRLLHAPKGCPFLCVSEFDMSEYLLEKHHLNTSVLASTTGHEADRPSQARIPAVLQASELRAVVSQKAEDHPQDRDLGATGGQLAAALQASELRSSLSPEKVRSTAASGLGGSYGKLPHLGRIQQSFGHHRLDDVRAH